MSAPPPASTDRRERSAAAGSSRAPFKTGCLLLSLSRFHDIGCAPYCAKDAHMCAAAAQIGLHVTADLIVGQVGIFLQQRLRAHDHSGNAIATLRRLLVNESLLKCAG